MSELVLPRLEEVLELKRERERGWPEMMEYVRGSSRFVGMATPLPVYHAPGGILCYAVQIATGTNETADHNLAQITIPPNTLTQSGGLFAEAYAFDAIGTSDNAASATLNFWIKIGSTKVQTAAVAMPASVGTAQRWDVRAVLSCRTTGSGGTAMIQIHGTHEKLATPYRFAANLVAAPATTAVNTTISNNILLGMNWSAASASNNCRCDATWVAKIGAAGL